MFMVPYILVIYTLLCIYLETNTKLIYTMELLEMTPHISSYAFNYFHYLLLCFQIRVYWNDIQISAFFLTNFSQHFRG
jgi:hypothetical protein